MNKLKAAVARVENKLMMHMAGIPEEKSADVLYTTESGDHLLEVLGTIIIAVVILIFFREQIVSLFRNAIGNTTNSVTNLFTNVTNG